MATTIPPTNLRSLPRKFLLCLLIASTLYLVHNIRTNRHKDHLNIIVLRGTFKQPANFTQQEIYQLENGFQDQEHPLLLKRLRTHWIHQPSLGPLKLAQPNKTHFSQHGQSELIDKLLKQRTNGFFIECGAHNGEELSNSLFFERSRNWTGLLIEPLPRYFHELLSKCRNAYSINACLNTRNITGIYPFYEGHLPGWGGLVHEMKRNGSFGGRINVQCFTLFSIMKAIGIKQVDLFSLDVEGAELGILKTIPFSYLDIDIFLIEYLIPGGKDKEGSKKRFIAIERFLRGKGYELVAKTFMDVIYRKIK